MAQEILLTAEAYKRKIEELEQLKTTGRDEIAERIKEARSFGDLSENSEYDEALNDQAKMEAKINQLENQSPACRPALPTPLCSCGSADRACS